MQIQSDREARTFTLNRLKLSTEYDIADTECRAGRSKYRLIVSKRRTYYRKKRSRPERSS
jgi:hypothetical protein